MSDSKELETVGSNPYLSYAAAAAPPVGQFLSFKNGEWLWGMDKNELPLGTQLAANMAGLKIGWRRWEAQSVAEEQMHLMMEGGPRVPLRGTLGDNDPSMWEHDNEGKPRDPWQRTDELTLMNREGEVFIYSASSFGGRGCIAKLCEEYGTQMRARAGQVPVVELSNSFYMHKTYGKTYVPVLNIVNWVDENRLDALKGKAEPEQLPPPKQVMAFEPGGKQAVPTKAEVAKANGRYSKQADPDDDIPF